MSENQDRFLVLAEGKLDVFDAKTAASLIRYRPDAVVAVLDSHHAGQTTREVLHTPTAVPVVGTLAEGLAGADFFLGLAGPELVTREQVATMTDDAIVFALSNPDPEIWPEDVPDNVRIMGTGRTDYPNQINNSLCFPGLFRGVLDVRAREINDAMKIAAAEAIANVIPSSVVSEDFIIPSVFDERVATTVADAVATKAQETEVARRRRGGVDDDDAHYATRRVAR